MRKTLLLPALALLLVLSVVAVPHGVSAHEGEDHSSSDSSKRDHPEDDTAKTETEKLSEERRSSAQKRLAELREKQSKSSMQSVEDKRKSEQKRLSFVKSCENRHENFKSRLGNIGSRAQKHAEKLDGVVTRVKAYKEKNNLEVANYDALLAAITTKKQVVDNLLAATTTAAGEFTCGETQDEAKAQLSNFKDALHQQITALKEYKTAVKDLIAAVRAAKEAGNE